jgi:hypothetical protein
LGKSTILKQMRLIHPVTFSPQETERFRQFGVSVRYPCEARRPRMVYVHNIQVRVDTLLFFAVVAEYHTRFRVGRTRRLRLWVRRPPYSLFHTASTHSLII